MLSSKNYGLQPHGLKESTRDPMTINVNDTEFPHHINNCSVKTKAEKERYKHLNAEFQIIARRDNKDFFSDHCKEIEEKIRNSKELTEAEEIKKRWQVYTEELYKKGLNDPDNHDGVIIHLEPGILQCEV